MLMLIGIFKETEPDERRVALSPDLVENYLKLGYEVVLEHGAGVSAGYTDESYQRRGAKLSDGPALWAAADIVLKIRAPLMAEARALKAGATVIAPLLEMRHDEALMAVLAAKRCNLVALELIPRISRAQKMDILSSMANIAGYRAVIEAAGQFGGFFTGQITAAGKIPPAKVLVIGAGVAGLSAIGAARSLGAIVRAFDIRKEVGEQIKSMGAEFLFIAIDEDGSGAGGYAKTMSPAFIQAEMQLFKQQAADVDIIITTALIPGRRAPILIDAEVFAALRPGSVVIDLAAGQGGNCLSTIADQVVVVGGVTVVGYTDYPSRMAGQASKLFAKNLYHLVAEFTSGAVLQFPLDDDIMRGALMMLGGAAPQLPQRAPQVTGGGQSASPALGGLAQPASMAATKSVKAPPRLLGLRRAMSWIALGVALVLVGAMVPHVPQSFFGHLTVFVLSCFVGYQVIWRVKPALHTPLMSVTNAISGIIILGALVPLTADAPPVIKALSGVALLLASINIVGGFFVTQKMLKMFRR